MNSILEVLLTTVATSTATITAVRFLGGEWIATRLKEGIAHEYRKSFETFRGGLDWQTRRRQQAAQIAGVLGIFARLRYVGGAEANQLRAELQERYWELALWLDAPVLRELNKCLVGGGQEGLQHKIALAAVRKVIVGSDDDIDPKEFVHWDPLSLARNEA